MKLYDWMKTHKAITAIVCVLLFLFQALIVHALHKWYIGIPWFTATWESGDVLAYISGFEAFIGTVFLGLVSLEQSKKADEANRRLNEENIYLQKIMSQKLFPVIQVCPLQTTPIDESYRLKNNFPSIRSFTRRTQYSHAIGYNYLVNIDIEDNCNEKINKKELTFSFKNISESVLRHICIEGVVIQGYKNNFPSIVCVNQRPGDGISALLKADDQIKVNMTFYFGSDKIKETWSHISGGLAVILYTTNTTITGVKFHEYMEISLTSTEIADISYGEKTFDVRGENNA